MCCAASRLLADCVVTRARRLSKKVSGDVCCRLNSFAVSVQPSIITKGRKFWSSRLCAQRWAANVNLSHTPYYDRLSGSLAGFKFCRHQRCSFVPTCMQTCWHCSVLATRRLLTLPGPTVYTWQLQLQAQLLASSHPSALVQPPGPATQQ